MLEILLYKISLNLAEAAPLKASPSLLHKCFVRQSQQSVGFGYIYITVGVFIATTFTLTASLFNLKTKAI